MFNFKKLFYKTSLYSQAGQDLFAYELFGLNGTYIDIGAGDPIRGNNCYLLETNYNWRGFSVDFGDSDEDIRQNLKSRWLKHPERKNMIYWSDAITFNYMQGINENNLDKNIDFLSCDIDPQEKTLMALKKVILDGIKPKLICFETDFYREKKDYSLLAYNFLEPYNYKIGVKNVYSNLKKNKIFETWFLRNDVDFQTIDYSTWVKKF
ncbi:hypothetical protein OAS29_00285 [Candidatus Pelagibacter sp.]|jgi:hypothetical protein|nr:hypothetical protein [Candidatus Pelagibacter sp.]